MSKKSKLEDFNYLSTVCINTCFLVHKECIKIECPIYEYKIKALEKKNNSKK